MHADFLPARIVEIKTPESILFGVGASQELPQRIKDFADGCVVIVTDSNLVKAGIVEKLRDLLSSAARTVAVFDAVEPDPDEACIEACLAAVQPMAGSS